MPGPCFLFVRIFLTSDVMIGGTSDVSGVVFFVRSVGLGVWNCTILCKSVCRSYVCQFCQFVFYFLHFSFRLSFSLVLL